MHALFIARCGGALVGAVIGLQTLAFLLAALLLPYPTANLVLDVVMLLLYLGVEVIRLFFGECCPENISILLRQTALCNLINKNKYIT